MKKIGLCVLALLMSACASMNGKSWWDARRVFVERFSTYPIVFYEDGEKVVSDELISEKSVNANEILTAYVGYSVVSDKVYQVKKFETVQLRANVDGFMHSASVPGRIPAGKTLQVIGTTEIDGVEYRLIPSEWNTFVYMLKPDGTLYDEMGQIRDGRLTILDATFVPSPDNFRIEPIKVSRTEQTTPVKGYDIKYQGVNLDRMVFTYYDYAQSQSDDQGTFEELSFPVSRTVVDINGVKIKVLNADKQKLEYILLPDNY